MTGWVVLFAVLGVVACLLLFVIWQLFGVRRAPRPKLPLERPNGLPVLLQNGLPYPGSFARTSNSTRSLDGNWRFGLGDVIRDPTIEMKNVTVPVSFNTLDCDLAFYQGPFSYIKTFYVDALEPGLDRLCLKSVGGACSVTLNGQKLCDNTDSYQPIFCDATGALRAGENTLVVVGDNTPTQTTLPPSQFPGSKLGWHVYAGITKGVLLEHLPKQYCVYLRIAAEGERLRGCAVYAGHPKGCRIRLLDGARILVEQELTLRPAGDYSTAEFELERPQGLLDWQPNELKLYTLEAQTEGETVAIETGFRSIRAEGQALLLNQSPFTVRGVCMHEEDIRLGSALDRAAVERNLSLAQELGCNFVRLAHYPHADETLELCDRSGLCCWSEIPNYQAGLGLVQRLFGKSKQLRQRVTAAKVVESLLGTRQLLNEQYLLDAGVQLAKMVLRFQNHPSVLFWGVGNECFAYTPASRRALRFLRDTVRVFDQTRLVGYAAFTIPKITQRFEQSFREFDVVCANEYFGWYYGEPDDCETFWRTLSRKYRKPMLCTETGSDARFGASGVDLVRKNANSEDYQVRMLERHLRLADEVPGYCGTCIWVLKDFFCDEYGAEDLVPHCNAKGLVSAQYQKKKAFFAVQQLYQAEQEQENGAQNR